MSKAKLTRSVWLMKPGHTLLIDRASTGRFRKSCERREKHTPYVFTIEKVDSETSKVTCHHGFDAPDKPHATKRRHPLHFLSEGPQLRVPAAQEASWRSTARYIESKSQKRFLFTRDGEGCLGVRRLPDGADKAAHKKPRSKYRFENIEVGETHRYPPEWEPHKVANALRDYERRSAHGFHVERKEDGLYVTRIW